MNSNGIRVSEELREEFEDLAVEDATLRAKYINFCAVIHGEQKQLAARAKEVWAEALFTMQLQGKWRYDNGMVYPVDEDGSK